MRVKKISAFVMAFVLCLSPFTLFSFAADTQSVKDSGSPEVSLMSLRSIAAVDGISLAAAEGNSGQFGYNSISLNYISPLLFDQRQNFGHYDIGYKYYLGVGTYSASFVFSGTLRGTGAIWSDDFGAVSKDGFISDPDSGSLTFSFTINNPGFYNVYFSGITDVELSLDDFNQVVLSGSVSRLIPVDGISSGYTYSSGIIENTTRSIFATLNPSFGNQPAGKYLVNIYHWGDSYDVRFQISDSTETYYLPTSTNGGVTTLVYNHPGGDFTLDGSFTASNDETSAVEGHIFGVPNGAAGDLYAYEPLSWVFNITDVVAIPYDQAADSNFGFFAPIIGFFRDQFSDLKSWIAIQIDKIAGDDETKSDVDDAQSELQKEVEDLNNLSGQLDTQASNLEQQFITDFAIPDTVSGQGINFQSIYTSLFGSLGVFGIFIWLPIVMAVIKKLLRL